MSKCLGCGIEIQNNDKEALGYSPKVDAKYCERCFRVKNYSESKMVDLPKDNQTIINEINKKANFVLFITDVLNITEEVIGTFKEIKKEKILVINKVDTFPKSLRKESVKNHLENYYGINNRIIFASASKGFGLNEIKNVINANNYTYLVGFTNSGKSSIINALRKEYGDTDSITTSIVPNTTIEFIKIRLGETAIVDSPGFNYSASIYNDNDMSLIKKTNMKNNINPLTYQIKDKDKILIEDIIRINSENKNSFTFYMSNNLKIKKIYKDCLEDLSYKTYQLTENKDLIIKGLGFINIKKPGTIKVYINDTNLIEIRDSIIGK